MRAAHRWLMVTLMILAALSLGALAAADATPAETPAPADAAQTLSPEASATDAPESQDAAPPWSPAPASTLTQKEFPLPRHDPRPLMQKLIDRNKPTSTTPFTFVAITDWHARQRDNCVFALCDKLQPDFILTLGDMVNTTGPELANWRLVESAGGDLFRKYPTWSVPGNPEIANNNPEATGLGRQRFTAYWAQPHDGVFSFRYANATFIGLPFSYPEDYNRLIKDVEKALASADNEHIVVFSHRPYYIGRPGAADQLSPLLTALFTKYKVRLVLSGHAHTYYRTRRNGVNYVICGAAGIRTARPLMNRTLPEDAWYGIGEEDNGLFHHPKLQKPLLVEGPKNFAVAITIEGPSVILRLLDTDGKEWELTTLTEPQAPAAAETDRQSADSMSAPAPEKAVAPPDGPQP